MFGLASVLGTQHRKVKTRERGVSGDPTASERGSRWGWKADNRSPRRLLRSGLDCGENDCNEVGCGGVQNIQELTQATAAVGCLLLQFRHYHGLFLAEDLDQEVLRVQRADAPHRQVLWPEVAKVEGKD